ncbi:retrovirus-related Pol polyprotein from transposon RE2 isoform X1 [Ziziphus jujuba]|uniref:Retrovirus-related Pol polyprotein from transposon RE2 isoform X1 n=1 Tax=Ziziphus jujuba TaxID=326968 RepID=A0ABM3IU69_ZIZJJ|nr:retrovirus-related Pol polyprotein from transposon RE2 isoform X1 [Ziziphus jujuba]XP_060674739.1 retrovirus-related Pol polyprotein from transposon RE2 isoform X1 [Ziziphus jujuba]
MGPASVSSKEGYKYYIQFLDDYSRYVWIYPLKTKSEALAIFSSFHVMVERQFDKKIKVLQADWGGEFRSFLPYLSKFGIVFRHPCPYIHTQNGKVERKHRHLVELGLCLLAQAHMSLVYWWEAFHCASFLINRLPTQVLNQLSPYEMLFHKKPDYAFLKVFGCACFPYLRPYNKVKLNFHTTKCVFLGYSPDHKGYRCLHPSGRVYITNSAIFHETAFPFMTGFSSSSAKKDELSSSCSSSDAPLFVLHKNVSSTPLTDSTPDISSLPNNNLPSSFSQNTSFTESISSLANNSPLPNVSALVPPANLSPHNCSPQYDTSTSAPNTSNSSSSLQSPIRLNTSSIIPQPVLSSSRTVLKPNTQSVHPMITRSKNGIFKPNTSKILLTTKHPLPPTSLSQMVVPRTVKAALLDPQWKSAMELEYSALMKNNTWQLVPCTSDMNIVGNKWVFRVKYNAHGTIQRCKARLVAKGFLQTPGLDYF